MIRVTDQIHENLFLKHYETVPGTSESGASIVQLLYCVSLQYMSVEHYNNEHHEMSTDWSGLYTTHVQYTVPGVYFILLCTDQYSTLFLVYIVHHYAQTSTVHWSWCILCI